MQLYNNLYVLIFYSFRVQIEVYKCINLWP